MTSPTSSRRTIPARSASISPARSALASSLVRRSLSLPREGENFHLNAARNVLPPIRTSRSQTHDDEGSDGTLTPSASSSESSPSAPEAIINYLYDRRSPSPPPPHPVEPSTYLRNRIHDRADSSLVVAAGAIPSSSSSSPPPAPPPTPSTYFRNRASGSHSEPPTPASPTLTPAQAAESMFKIFTPQELAEHTPTREYIEQNRRR